MAKLLRWFLVSVVLVVLTACGGEGSSSNNNPGVMPDSIEKPQAADLEKDAKSLAGIDANSDGVRDVVELAVYKRINLSDNSPLQAEKDYKLLLSMIKEIQPSDTSGKDSIDEHKFYCQYIQLSEATRNRLSYDVLLEMIQDTSERRKAYQKSLKPVATSRGAEKCD